MSRPEHLDKHHFVLYWDAKPVGEVYIGHGFYIFENTKKKWNIAFAETTPIEIKEQIENEFIHQNVPSSSNIIVSTLKNFERALYNRIFEPHDEMESCDKFPGVYKQIKDPILKKLVKEKVSGWANSEYFGTGPMKQILKELNKKLEEIDEAEGKISEDSFASGPILVQEILEEVKKKDEKGN